MRSTQLITLAFVVAAVACEDGPEQIYEPFKGNPDKQNGTGSTSPPWTQEGTKGFDDETASDSAGRAKFCDESEITALVQSMVTKPILPDTSVGGVSLWTAEGNPMPADDLVGRPEDGKFCDPEGIYLDAFTYGPTQEVIVLFDQETRLVNGLIAFQQYLGSLSGQYTKDDASKVDVVIRPRERVKIGGTELSEWTSRAQQASKPNAWMNHANVTAIYRMLRETYFASPPLPDSFDCVEAKLCDLIYTNSDETQTDDTGIVFRDSGIYLQFTPDGRDYFVMVEPVRVAPFEGAGAFDFVSTGTVDPTFVSTSFPGCTFALDEALTFAEFKTRCIGATNALQRVTYDVYGQRDAVQVLFNGTNLTFQRNTTTAGVLRDGQAPGDNDELVTLEFTRVMNAPVDEFRAQALAVEYAARLRARLRDYAYNNALHPLWLYNVVVPASLSSSAQAIGELFYEPVVGEKKSWLPKVLEDIQAAYEAMSPSEQAATDPHVLEPVYLVEPFVDAVLAAFTNGASDAADAVKHFETTEDGRWSIGYAHIFVGAVPYRVVVQYSLNFGAVTAVTYERGFSELDAIMNGVNEYVRTEAGEAAPVDPYYELRLAKEANNPYGLGGDGVVVDDFDRQLNTLDVKLKKREGAAFTTVDMTVPGTHVIDEGGYQRQIGGSRYEWVPAHVVGLVGREHYLRVYVDEADGKIGRVMQFNFKGKVELCDGFEVSYGDELKPALAAWAATVSPQKYASCGLAFNYSLNGNVLYGVASLSQKTEISVAAGRAVTATMWR